MKNTIFRLHLIVTFMVLSISPLLAQSYVDDLYYNKDNKDHAKSYKTSADRTKSLEVWEKTLVNNGISTDDTSVEKSANVSGSDMSSNYVPSWTESIVYVESSLPRPSWSFPLAYYGSYWGNPWVIGRSYADMAFWFGSNAGFGFGFNPYWGAGWGSGFYPSYYPGGYFPGAHPGFYPGFYPGYHHGYYPGYHHRYYSKYNSRNTVYGKGRNSSASGAYRTSSNLRGTTSTSGTYRPVAGVKNDKSSIRNNNNNVNKQQNVQHQYNRSTTTKNNATYNRSTTTNRGTGTNTGGGTTTRTYNRRR